MNEQDPDLLADDKLDGLRGRNPYSPMSERFRLTELLENSNYQNNLLAQKCRELEAEVEKLRPIANEQYRSYELAARVLKERDEARQERDEARRMACEKEETLGCDERGVPMNGSARDHAKQRGWDCFKEDTDD